MNGPRAVISKLRLAWKLLTLHEAERTYLASVRECFGGIERATAGRETAGEPVRALCQLPQDHFFWLRLLPILEDLRLDPRCRIDFVDPLHDFHRPPPTTRLGRVQERLEELKWRRLYRLRGSERIALRFRDRTDEVHFARARAIVATLETRADLVGLTLDDVPVGDLIHDTYLRYKPAPFVDLRDEMLIQVIGKALLILARSAEYLRAHAPSLLLTTYTTYIEHGILVRLALRRGVRVFAVGAVDPFLREVELDFPNHGKDHTKYRRLFQQLAPDEQRSARAAALRILQERFAGKIDPAIGYMKASSFGPVTEEDRRWRERFVSEPRHKVLVGLHCFFDSPHIYRDMLFADFHAWAEFVLERTAKLGNTRVYVKPHPNGLPGNDAIVRGLLARHPHAVEIPARLSNRVIAESGFAAILTVYGTIGHEMSFHGVPVINAGDNPHAEYEFCLTPRSTEELAGHLAAIDQGRMAHTADREEIAEFYFMHALFPHRGRGPEEARRRYLAPFNNIWGFDEAAFRELMRTHAGRLAPHIEAMLVAAHEVLPAPHRAAIHPGPGAR